MTDPLTLAVVGGLIGGAVTGLIWTLVGFWLTERATKARASEERRMREAKASVFIGALCINLRTRIDALPKSPQEVTNPSSQLAFRLRDIYQHMGIGVKDLADAIAELPSAVKRETMEVLNRPPKLELAVALVRRRCETMRLVHRTDAPSFLDQHRTWEVGDTKDEEFVREFTALTDARKEALDALDVLMPKLVDLAVRFDS